MDIKSETFSDGQPIPDRCAFGIPDPDEHLTLGENRNPQLSWTGVPARISGSLNPRRSSSRTVDA